MLEFHPVELKHKELLTPYLKKNPYHICDYSFANLYMWRLTLQSKFALFRDYCILSIFDNTFMMPVGEGELRPVLEEMISYAWAKGIPFRMAAVTPLMRRQMEEAMPGRFSFQPDRDHSDYLYLSKSLISLEGKKLHNKRNHIHKFHSMYQASYEDMTESNIPEVVDMHRLWCEENDYVNDPQLLEESGNIRDVLLNYTQLDLKGGLLRVDGRVAAFSFGQAVNETTFDVMVEKAFYDIEGAYTVINQMFAERNCGEYLYINREDDMGLEGLRKAKLSYHPALILDKGIVTLKEEEES